MSLLDDCTMALRRLLAAPGDALTLVLIIATGITISALLFAVLNGVRAGPPLPDPQRLVVVESASAERGVQQGGLTPAEALSLGGPDSPFAAFGYYGWGGMAVYQEERPREFYTSQVSAGFFASFAVPPALGRWFQAADYVREPDVVVLSHAEWQRLFGGANDVIGRRLETNHGSKRIVGVMPAFFTYPSRSVGAWLPMPADSFPRDQPWIAEARYLSAVARLDPALDAQALADRLAAHQAALAEQYRLPGAVWAIQPRTLREAEVGALEGVLWAAFGIGLLVMLIACGNAAILVDARQSTLAPQQALQLALGCERSRLVRERVLELLLIGAVAAGLGCLAAMGLIEALRDLARGSLPRVDAIAIDAPVWAFVIGMALLVPLVAGLSGALTVRAEAGEALRGGHGVLRRSRRRWLPALGVALSTASVVAGSALVLSLWQLQRVDPGLKPAGVYVLQLFRTDEPDALRDFAARLSERLAAIPGVEAVALGNAAPLSIVGNFDGAPKLAEREAAEPWLARIRRVSPDYLAVLGQPLLSGRGVADSDRAGNEAVAVINTTLARRLYGDASPLGQIVELPVGSDGLLAHRVVGVMGDTRNRGLGEASMPEVLLPYAAAPTQSMSFLIRAPTGLTQPDRQLRDALYDIDPRESATRTFALQDEFAAGLDATRFFARTMGAVALGALLLAAFGVYAVAALQQRQRSAELGLRLAIGAPPTRLLADSLRDSSRSALLGVLLGSGLAVLVLRGLSAQLHGVAPFSAAVLGFGAAVLLLTSLLAALPPALRAMRLDPVIALRGR